MPNVHGTDFVAGDVHGCFHLLAEALERVGFNPNTDRLFLTGDLIDRGIHNEMALEWLRQTFVHSVRGNHEELYLKWYSLRNDKDARKIFERDCYFANGGEWVKEVDEETHERLAAQLAQLPYFLSVSAPDGRTIGIVHAELPDGTAWPQLISQPPDEELRRSMLWGRQRLRHARRKSRGVKTDTRDPADSNSIPGLALLLCGHFRVSSPKLLGNILYIDTGGWSQRGHFTVLRLEDALLKLPR